MKNVFLFLVPFVLLLVFILVGVFWGVDGVVAILCLCILFFMCAILGAIVVDEFGD